MAMGVYARPDSPYWWLYLETTHQKERTSFKIGDTATQRRDSRRLAEDRYHQRMNELAARLYKLPSAQPSIRFAKYALTYAADTIAHHAGATRELELLKNLRAFFDDDLLSGIDQDRVKAYHTHRKAKASARTINREIDLLKAMLRDAVPKYVNTSPLAGMRRLRVTPPRRRLLSYAEERQLLKACEDAQDRAILILGIDTMIRLGDLLDLQRSDRAGVWLYVRDPKGGEPYAVALTKRAAAALTAIKSEGRYYFSKFRRALNPRDWPGSVRQRLEYLCRQVNLPYGRAKDGITFHWATRRTGATRLLVQKRVPLPVVQKQGAWKTPDVLLEIYADAGQRDQLEAVGQFPVRSRSKRKRA
jgi:integrase